MRSALPYVARPSVALVFLMVGTLLGGCRPGHPAPLAPDVTIPADTAAWCAVAPTAQTVHAAACALRPNETVAVLRRRYPRVDFERPRPAMAIGVRPGEIRFGMSEIWGTLDLFVGSLGLRPDPDPDPILGGDSVLVATESSRLRGARQYWNLSDTARFRRALVRIEAGLARIGARLVGCRSWIAKNQNVDATYADGERIFHVLASADTLETYDPLRLDIRLTSAIPDPGATFVRVPGCDAPTRTDFGTMFARAYAGADSPERLARRRRYFASTCVAYRRAGHQVPATCHDVRESDVDEFDREDFRRLFRRDSLTPPPAPPPIPASSR